MTLIDAKTGDYPQSPITNRIAENERSRSDHRAGSIENSNLARIEKLIRAQFGDRTDLHTLETGCGKTTVLFSNYAHAHEVFCVDDRDESNSSVNYLLSFSEYNAEVTKFNFGPTQQTLPRFDHATSYDVVLLDGPHGYPFPDLEYYFVYPHLKENSLLLVDDIQIPSIGSMFDILKEDWMFDFIGLIGYMGVLKRNATPCFDPFGDNWWVQHFNRRRTSLKQFRLRDGGRQPSSRDMVNKKRLFRKLQLHETKRKRLFGII